jgi:charged multivesicular body protein 2A
MAEAMKGVTRAMKSMNKKMNMPAIQKIMMDFEKESEIMDMKSEMMDDTIDDALDEDEDEEESEAIVNQVLDEIGISLEQSLPGAGGALPSGAVQETQKQKVAEPMGGGPDDDSDLQARLDNLRRGGDD